MVRQTREHIAMGSSLARHRAQRRLPGRGDPSAESFLIGGVITLLFFHPKTPAFLYKAAVPHQPVEGSDHFYINGKARLPQGPGTCPPPDLPASSHLPSSRTKEGPGGPQLGCQGAGLFSSLSPS